LADVQSRGMENLPLLFPLPGVILLPIGHVVTGILIQFPAFPGLGHSVTARRYAIKGREEAQQYLNHRVLGNRLRECTQAVVDIEGRPVSRIFAYPDDLKFASCMTLFSQVAEEDALFDLALEKYFDGALDARTLELL
jgi:uncharacterized protein (DUF1810 family)